MGPLVSERAPTTPKHPLSNTDFKTFEKKIGRRISLRIFSSIMVAKMHTYSGLPNGAGSFIPITRSRTKEMFSMGRKHPEAAGGSGWDWGFLLNSSTQ